MISTLAESLRLLHTISAVGFLAVVIFAYKLYSETDKGWYWVSLLLAAFFFAIAHWSTLLFPLSVENFELLAILQETSEIVASLLFAVACYGMYKTMKHIRKRVE